jgi:hypothetical protein
MNRLPNTTDTILAPFGRDLDAEAAYVRRVPAEATVQVSYQLAGMDGWRTGRALNDFERDALALVLESAKSGSGVAIRVDLGSPDEPDLQSVPLEDVLAIRIEVWS